MGPALFIPQDSMLLELSLLCFRDVSGTQSSFEPGHVLLRAVLTAGHCGAELCPLLAAGHKEQLAWNGKHGYFLQPITWV